MQPETKEVYTSTAVFRFTSIACSADGVRLVAAANSYGGLYTSADSGTTWTPAGGPDYAYVSVASSADGTELAAAAASDYYPYSGPIVTLFSPSAWLKITPTGGALMLSWLPPSFSFKLQQNSDLTSTNWTNVTTAVVSNPTNLQNEVTLTPQTAGNMFYRLTH
jgi:hypothetical protein